MARSLIRATHFILDTGDREEFAGAPALSDDSSLMIKRALPVLVGLFSVCLAAAATGAPGLDLDRHDVFSTVEGSLLIQSLPVMTLLDDQRLPAPSALGRMGRTSLDVAPLAYLSPAPRRSAEISPIDPKDAPGEILSLRDRLYTWGEVGFLYGTSAGKHGGDVLAGYIVSGIGNDKFQLTVGASYEESSVRSRYQRYR